ncbi:MAG: hypothetical protein ISR64_10775 [Deltaproteobacteria bacterium]|nr:hypothetical protein [Deltaproteobacteria bacterium]
MSVEWIPQAGAIVLAAGGAVTDAMRGKIYNRWVLCGLVMAAAWVLFVGLWNTFGGAVEYGQYPQLGQWTAADPRTNVPRQTDAPAPWEVPEGVSVKTADAPYPSPDTTVRTASTLPAPAFWVYLAKVLLNALLALVTGFILWWFGLWAAGDAKLFGVLAAMLPLSTYSQAYMALFPAYVLIFNTFVSVMALLVLEMAARTVRQVARPTEDETQAWRKSLKWVRDNTGQLLLGFFGILFLFICIKTLRMVFRDAMSAYTALDNKPLVFLVLFLVFMPIARAMRRLWVGIPIVTGTLAWIVYVGLYPTDNYNLGTVLSMGSLALTLITFYILYGIYLNVFDFKAVKVWELKPRMILSRRTQEVLKEDEDLLDHKMGPVAADGLRPEQAEVLRRWWIDRDKGSVIWVSRTIPFAPALLMGTVLTVVLGGYVVWT